MSALARVRVATLFAGLAVAATAGCSSGPKVSGFGLFDNRTVRVGEAVEVTVPWDDRRGMAWRLSSYDSVMLTLAGQPTVVSTPDGSGQVLAATFTARTEGATQIVFQRTGPAAGQPEQKTFNIRILGN